MIGILIFTVTALLLGTLLVLTDNHFKKEDNKIEENLPGYNCGVCGFGSCAGMKEAILENPDNYKRCKLLKDSKAIEYFESLKSNKAFTLVELLAVIIIIGLIAVITLPKISDSLEESKKNLSKTSAQGYAKTIDEYVLKKQMNKEKINLNGEYNIDENGNLYNSFVEYNLEYKGQKPKSGTLTFFDNELQSGCITINKYKVTIENGEVVSSEKGSCVYTSIKDNIVSIAQAYATSVETEKDGESGMFDLPIVGISNENIDSGWIFLIDGEVEGYSLKINSFVVTLSDGNITITNTTELANKSVAVPESESFAEDSWKTIKANLIANRSAYAIGDTKEEVIDNVSYTVRLANTSSCPDNWPEAASQTTCGVVIEFIDTIKDSTNNNTDGHVMNPSTETYTHGTNIGGWPASSMRSYLNETLFNKLPEELKANGMILDTSVVSGHGETEGETNFTSTDKLYLLSYVELMGSNLVYDSVKLVDGTVTDGTRQLQYYGTTGSTRIKNTTEGSAKTWWLRSANSNDTETFRNVSTSGAINSASNAKSTNGVAPAFRILD